jgi:hypothetical protein
MEFPSDMNVEGNLLEKHFFSKIGNMILSCFCFYTVYVFLYIILILELSLSCFGGFFRYRHSELVDLDCRL